MLPKKRILLMAILVLSSLLLLPSCGQQTTTTAPTTPTKSGTATTSATTPQSGGVLKIISTGGKVVNIGFPGQPDIISDGTIAKASLDTFTIMDEKGTELPKPWLATAWKYSPDYKSVTFTLRKGLKFQDGTDFNAESAKYCLDLVRVSNRTELKSVSSIDIVDDNTIRFNLSAYEPYLLTSLAGTTASGVTSPAALKALGNDALTHPVGTGPFKFVSFQRDTFVKFEKYAGYWQKGKPYLDGIQWSFIADSVTALASFKAGEGQVITGITAKDAADLKATGKYNINTTVGMVQGLVGDSAHPESPFANIKVRQAIAYAIDNQAIAKALGYGLLPSATQFQPPDHGAYNPAIKGYPYNPQKAKQLLTEAGFPNGFETKILFSSSTGNTNLFTAVQGYLAEIGIKANLDPADAARATQTTSKGWNNHLVSFDVPCSGGMDPGRGLDGRLSPNSGNRFDPKSIWRPADYDDKLAKANSETDLQKRMTMLKELHKMIIDDYCLAIPVYVGGSFYANTPDVRDLDMTIYAVFDWRPENAWLSK